MSGSSHTDAVSKLQRLVRIPTVSYRDPGAIDRRAFDDFHAELAASFPLLHQHLERIEIHDHAVLYRWPGAAATHPVVLMAHIDVVPVEGEWQYPPFSAEIADGAIWGRGTLDDKGSLVAICEAVERMLADGVTPAQDVWLSFGADEEVSGDSAPLAVAALRERGVSPWFVLDEGGAIAHQAFPGVSAPIGVVGVSEKGVTSLELHAEGRGGHASTPARNGPTARIARAITRLDAAPMAPHLPEPTVELFRRIGAGVPAPLRPLISQATRMGPLFARALIAAGPEAAALVRTTFAVTTLSGSPALNVIAARAKAGVNIRVMVGDTVDEAIAHIRKVIADDEIRIDVLERNEPSPISPRDDAFALIESTISRLFPDAVPAPYVMMAATDSRFFTEICDRVYRFAPFRMTKEQRESIHSYDEHLGVDAFLDGIDWYRRLLEGLPA
ncbi:M20/M25/M40 family metallo-hydrolase [Nocardioides sp. Bht2]|uniref:M20/M25/M40 family metallo-hydrolase n=1 Tax=Nocardioides sp. Bht2 TaxID=3392297 RepID=UPI0039B5B2D1